MPSYIHFIGSPDGLLVAETHQDVTQALADGADEPFVTFMRKAAYSDPGTVEGKTVHVRPDAVSYVSDT